MGSVFAKPGAFRELKRHGNSPQARIKYVPTKTKPYSYHEDGSGRDGYIQASMRGTASVSQQTKQASASETFYNSLRVYEAGDRGMRRSPSNEGKEAEIAARYSNPDFFQDS